MKHLKHEETGCTGTLKMYYESITGLSCSIDQDSGVILAM